MALAFRGVFATCFSLRFMSKKVPVRRYNEKDYNAQSGFTIEYSKRKNIHYFI